MQKIQECKKKIESTGMHVEMFNMSDTPFLIVKRKAKSKKHLLELVFNKKNKLTHLVIGNRDTDVVWIKI